MKPNWTIPVALCAGLLLGLSAPLAGAAEFVLPTDGTIVGEVGAVTVQSDATLYDIARHYDLGFEEITGSNPGVNVWVPGRGRRIIVPTVFILPPKPWSGIVLNLAARRLYYFPKPTSGKPATVVTFPIGIGRPEWSTPLGHTVITAKVRNPAWAVPKSILEEHERNNDPLPAVVPPGPNNPMGLLALETGFPGIYLHGTNLPWSVGGVVSHGCIHLYPEDVAAIFDRVPVGTPVRVTDMPDLVGERDGVIFLAAFPSSTGAPDTASPAQRAVRAVVAYLQNRSVTIDWERVGKTAQFGSTVPTPINTNTANDGYLAADTPAQPYSDPPYGPDANAAAPPSSVSD